MNDFSIGVDLGGTNLRVGAFTRGFERIAQHSIPTRVSSGPEAVARDIASEIEKLLHACSGQGELQGIGMGAPGPLELPEGRLGAPPNLPGFENFELKKTLESMLELPVCLESDGNTAALAECVAGAGREYGENSLCMLTLGTGVGSGIVLHGRLWHGMNGMAGEAGHIPIFPEGARCACGGRGCLELYASATGIRRAAVALAKTGNAPVIAPGIARALQGETALAVFELAHLAEAGDVDAMDLFRHAGRSLGIGLATLVNVLNLPLYAIGGGVAKARDLFAPSMMDALAEFSYVYRLTRPTESESKAKTKGRTHVAPATLGSEAGLLGAAMLPWDRAS